MKIFMIEDDKSIIEALQDVFENKYDFDYAYNIETAYQKLNESVDLILLDIQLPDGNGLDFIKEYRLNYRTPIILLSVLSDEQIIANGLDLGADDYMTKPFSVKVMLSRIKSVLRRYYGNTGDKMIIGDLSIDFEKKIVYKKDEFINLTYVEEQLFFNLVKGKGRVLSRRFLLEQIWDKEEQFIEDNTLTVHMTRLKNKIGNQYIQTKRKVGYCFAGDVNEE